jgi:hypothetical protein
MALGTGHLLANVQLAAQTWKIKNKLNLSFAEVDHLATFPDTKEGIKAKKKFLKERG